MHLVLRSGGERREALRLVGEELSAGWGTRRRRNTAAGPPRTTAAGRRPARVARLQATRWATELDIGHYRAEQPATTA